MYIHSITISNYRQLTNVCLNFQKNLTVLAGPNNSGKTSLITLLNEMFNNGKMSYSYLDIPTKLSIEWVDKIIPVVQSIILSNDKEIGVSQVVTAITEEDKFKQENRIQCFEVKVQVDYDPESDVIQEFADYLMDLDETKHSFYFLYTFIPSVSVFERLLGERYEKIKDRFIDLEKPDCLEKEAKQYSLKDDFLKLYCDCLVEKCYFCNSDYSTQNTMEISEFKKLFNFKSIKASRNLDDSDKDSSKGISKSVVSLLKNDDEWVLKTKELPNTLLNGILQSGAKTVLQKSSVDSLDKTIQDISKTSGGHVGKIQLEMDVDESDVDQFIQKITRAKYDIDGLLLNESSQGLGFSNLIYLHMQLEDFYKSMNPKIVNVFFIEEPESHMHPQMQNIFIKYLKSYYEEKSLQGLITTHSNEIAKSVDISSLRVIRQTEKSKSELFDLSEFKKSIEGEKIEEIDDDTICLLENFYDWFFEIGYSELIFADKVILYEGDSERLYFRKLINLDEFSALSNSYIAFIQVGGAYALNYRAMLTELRIKTLIITDLDYSKSAAGLSDVKSSNSTNATINSFYKRLCGADKNPNIEEIYQWQTQNHYIISDGSIGLTFQDEDSTARTLEEAMLAKLQNSDVFKKINRSEWKTIRKNNKLKFTIPNNKQDEDDSEYSIRDIVEATSNGKTDFMYSVILSGNESKMLPDYIYRGLLWLAK